MFAFLVRSAGLVVFVASFVALIADGIASLAADRIVTTPLAEGWAAIDPGSLDRLKAVVEGRLTPYLWDPVAVTLLGWPTFAVGGTIGIVLMLLGARRVRPKRLTA